MARPTKKGLDYFPFDVDLFNDEKVEAISGEFGVKGELSVIRLLCAIYRNGYFIVWDELKAAQLARQVNATGELVDNIVHRLVRWGFFDESLFNSAKVLSSTRIQTTYFEAVQRRKLSDVNLPHLLINVDINRVNVNINPTSTDIKASINPQIKVNKIKLNESISLSGANAPESRDAERDRFFEIFFFRNFSDPKGERERFINYYKANGWCRSGKTTPVINREALAEAWTQKGDKAAYRFTDEVLKVLANIFELYKSKDRSNAQLFIENLQKCRIEEKIIGFWINEDFHEKFEEILHDGLGYYIQQVIPDTEIRYFKI